MLSGYLPPRLMPSPLKVAATAYDFVLGNSNSPGAYAFSGSFVDGQLVLPGVMSRKKQVVPPLAAALT